MKDRAKRVLILDNDEFVLIELQHVLEDAGFQTTITWDMREADQFLSTDTYDFLLLGDCFSRTEVERMLEHATAAGNNPRCVVLAAHSRGAGVPAGGSAAVCKRHPGEVLHALSAVDGPLRRGVSTDAV